MTAEQFIPQAYTKKEYFDQFTPKRAIVVTERLDPSIKHVAIMVDDPENVLDSPYCPVPIRHGNAIIMHEVDKHSFHLYQNRVICIKGNDPYLRCWYCHHVYPGHKLSIMTFVPELYREISFNNIEHLFVVDAAIENPEIEDF